MTTGFDLIVSGSIIQGAFSVYTTVMGQWFWFFFFLIPMVMIYLKTENYIVAVVTFLIVYPIVVPTFLPPEVHVFVTPLIYIAGALILWRLIKTRGE